MENDYPVYQCKNYEASKMPLPEMWTACYSNYIKHLHLLSDV